jgi:hypothetical protein
MLLIIVLIIITAGAVGYALFIRSKMAAAAASTGKSDVVAASTGFAKFWAILEGWKSSVLAWIAAAAQAIAFVPHLLGYVNEDLLKQWQALPWITVFDAKVANFVTFACAMLIPITHAAGLAKAAATPPVNPSQTPGS